MNTLRALLLGGCAVGLFASACDEPPRTNDATGSARAAQSAGAAPTVSATPSVVAPSASAAEPAPVKFAPSERPTDAEWAAAPDVPEAAWTSAPSCSARNVREWVRFHCKGSWLVQPAIGLGSLGTTHFTSMSLGGVGGVSLIAQAMPGTLGGASLSNFENNMKVTARIVWPTNAAGPTFKMDGDAIEPFNLGEHQSTVPPMPSKPTPKPARADWLAAPLVNTAPTAERAKSCEVRVLGDWLRLRCKMSSAGFMSVSGFGKLGVDYETVVELGTATLITRLHPGQAASAQPDFSMKLSVSWPSGAAAPTEISMTGPPL